MIEKRCLTRCCVGCVGGTGGTTVEKLVLGGRFDGGRTNSAILHCWFIDFFFWIMYFACERTNKIMRAGIVLFLLGISLGAVCSAQEGRAHAREGRPQSAEGSHTRSQEPREKKKTPTAPRHAPSSQKEPETVPSRHRSSEGQDSAPPVQEQRQRPDRPIREEHKRVFETVRSGLVSGQVSSLSEHMGAQVYVNLRGGESGYFSANQAYYLLENYLRTRKFSSLEFNTMGEDESTPYATGIAGFDHKGSQESAQVYVSLSEVGEQWVISQIKIY